MFFVAGDQLNSAVLGRIMFDLLHSRYEAINYILPIDPVEATSTVETKAGQSLFFLDLYIYIYLSISIIIGEECDAYVINKESQG
jgi:hypothetical protein